MNTLFYKRITIQHPGGCACSYPCYPNRLTEHETLKSQFWFERLPQRGLSGGSLYKAYIRARCFASRSAAYMGQYYVMFAGPKGFLP